MQEIKKAKYFLTPSLSSLCYTNSKEDLLLTDNLSVDMSMLVNFHTFDYA